MRQYSCAFTGYRPQKLPYGFNENDPRCQEFKVRLQRTIEELICLGYTHFLSGGALGVDMFAAESVLDLRDQYPQIKLEVVVPFIGQAERWAPEYRRRYRKILDRANSVITISTAYTSDCLFRRNRYLVDHSDLLLAAYDGAQQGGTAMTCAYAEKLGRHIIRINPFSNPVYTPEQSLVITA